MSSCQLLQLSYAVAFVDEFSKFKVVIFCRDRTAPTLMAAYRAYVGEMRSYGVFTFGTLQSDQGPEYVAHEAFDFCDEHAVNRLLSVRYTPQQNGAAEAVFGVYIPRARAALRACGMGAASGAGRWRSAMLCGRATGRIA